MKLILRVFRLLRVLLPQTKPFPGMSSSHPHRSLMRGGSDVLLTHFTDETTWASGKQGPISHNYSFNNENDYQTKTREESKHRRCEIGGASPQNIFDKYSSLPLRNLKSPRRDSCVIKQSYRWQGPQRRGTSRIGGVRGGFPP